MNRKISTLLTAGLLVAGSLCGSAFAQTVSIKDLTGIGSTAANELKNGARYVMVDASSSLAYGHEISTTTGKIVEVGETINTPIFYDDSDSKDDVKKYIWTVSVTEAPRGFFSYTLTNAETGKALRYNSAYNAIEKDPTAKAEDTFKDFVFEATSTVTSTPTGAKYSASNNYMVAYKAGATTWNGLSWSGSPLTSTVAISAPAFYEVKSEKLEDASELNALYNTSGFSFASKRLTDQTAEPNGNLFNTKRVVARYVSSAIDVDATQYPSYAGGNDDLRIEPGMYFFTENAPKDGADYKEWMNATILVVSSTETVEATNAGRASGDGFALTEVKVSDLNFYQGTDDAWKTAGNEISINNAKFRVQKSYVDAYPYELNVDGFRYRKQGSKAEHGEANVKLHVLEHNDDFFLTTTHDIANDQFIFQLAAAGMKKGIDLLNTEAKVAAYTIRILDGKEYAPSTDNIDKKDIKSVYGKYLTNAVNNASRFELVAKAKVLSQLETPAYQWAISSVDDTYKVTFTNRETGEYFTASLFPKTDLGENVYELAVANNEKVTAIYVNENTYNETEGGDANLQQLIVELTPAEVDPYAGFLNLDDETLVTMAFARDNNETSNKWYAAVKNQIGSTTEFQLNKNGKFSNEVFGAAQWQLVKEDNKRTIIERSFVYNRDGRVTVQARADKGYAYVYQLQYINDGIETERYFPQGGTFVDENESLVREDNARFVIKLAADGSVYLIPVTSTSASIASILNENTKSVVDATYDASNDICEYDTPSSVYAWPSTSTQQDWLLNTYLIVEAPEISYPAEEGHISLVGESNYVSMNENRDGIVVNENQYSFYLQVTDEDAVVPSFYISNKGTVENGDRLFLFNPADSVSYYVADGTYDRKYQWNEDDTKAIFKPATLWETKDTLTTVVKGNKVSVAKEADDEGVLGGLDYFKVQIIQCEDNENEYRIRSVAKKGSYLYSINEKLSWSGDKKNAMRFTISAGDPTSNESIADAAEGVKVIAGNGVVEIQGAAGKNVVITNVLGKVITSTVLTSDNATIAAPAGIIVVAVDGEAAVKAVVK